MATPLSELFAPAYRRSDPNSVAAVDAFMTKKYPITGADLDSTKMPTPGITGGVVDPNALRAVAQGNPSYDINARRDSIAAQVQANTAAAAPQQQQLADPNTIPAHLRAQMSPQDIAIWQQAMGGGGGMGTKVEDQYSTGYGPGVYQNDPFGGVNTAVGG